MPTYIHNNLSLTLPEGWDDASQYIFGGPVADGIRTNVVVTQQPLEKGETIDSVWAKQKPQLSAAIANFKISVEEKKKIGAHAGLWAEFSGAQQGRQLSQIVFLLPASGTISLSVTGTAAPSQSDALRKLMNDAIVNLKLK